MVLIPLEQPSRYMDTQNHSHLEWRGEFGELVSRPGGFKKEEEERAFLGSSLTLKVLVRRAPLPLRPQVRSANLVSRPSLYCPTV